MSGVYFCICFIMQILCTVSISHRGSVQASGQFVPANTCKCWWLAIWIKKALNYQPCLKVQTTSIFRTNFIGSIIEHSYGCQENIYFPKVTTKYSEQDSMCNKANTCLSPFLYSKRVSSFPCMCRSAYLQQGSVRIPCANAPHSNLQPVDVKWWDIGK